MKQHKSRLSRIFSAREMPIIVFTLLVYGTFSVMAPNFNTFNNVSVIAQQITINGIVALGMTIVIMIGGMDLSDVYKRQTIHNTIGMHSVSKEARRTWKRKKLCAFWMWRIVPEWVWVPLRVF